MLVALQTVIFKNTFFNRTYLQKTNFFSVYNSKWRKIKKFNGNFDQYQDHFFDLKLTWNYLFIHTYYYWKSKHGNVKENASCAISGIQLLSIFEILGQKLEALLSIFCGAKINLEWTTSFLDLPPTHYALHAH